jgi:hypothetical protein
MFTTDRSVRNDIKEFVSDSAVEQHTKKPGNTGSQEQKKGEKKRESEPEHHGM